MPRGRKAKVAEEKNTEVAVEEVKEIKEEVDKNAEAVVEEAPAETEKEETAAKEAPAESEEAKPAPKKRGRKPASEKAETKPAPKKRGRKPASEKVEAKPAPKEIEANIILQFDFGEFVSKDLVDRCKEAYKAENKAKIKTIDIYVKPSDKKAYYVVNDKSAGYVDLEN